LLALTIKLDRQAVNQIAAVAPPRGDEATIVGWAADLRGYIDAEAKAVGGIRADKSRRAYRLLVRAIRPVLRDNEALKPFGFQHCTF
jgi:hypothetical protein